MISHVSAYARHFGTGLILAGAILLLYSPALWLYGTVSQYYLHKNWRAHSSAVAANSDVVGRLAIPKIQVDQIVLEGVSDAQLARGPGHFPTTAKPGKGNCAIAGHLNTNGSPFKDLDQLSNGDEVLLEYGAHLYFYKVIGRRIISAEDVDVLDQDGPRRLTLITCMPGARDRLVITCRQVRVE